MEGGKGKWGEEELKGRGGGGVEVQVYLWVQGMHQREEEGHQNMGDKETGMFDE